MDEHQFRHGKPKPVHADDEIIKELDGGGTAGVASAEEVAALEGEAGPHREDILLALRQELAVQTQWRDDASDQLERQRDKVAELHEVLTRQELASEHAGVPTLDLLQNLIDGGRMLLDQAERQNQQHADARRTAEARVIRLATRSDRIVGLLAEVLTLYVQPIDQDLPVRAEGRVTPP